MLVQTDSVDANVKDYLFLNQFSEATGISKGQINWIIFNRKRNGADHFLRRLGRKRWMASPARFYEWLEKEGKNV